MLWIQIHYFLDILSSLPKAREIGARPDELDSRQLYTLSTNKLYPNQHLKITNINDKLGQIYSTVDTKCFIKLFDQPKDKVESFVLSHMTLFLQFIYV